MRSFVKDNAGAPSSSDAGTATATTEAPRTVEAKPSGGAVSRYTNTVYVEGEINSSDLKTPYLSCVQGVGPKSVMFTPGTVLLGDTVLSKAPEARQPTSRLKILFCRPVKVYEESLPYNPAPDAPRPRIFKTSAEVLQAGGTLSWVGRVGPSFVPRLTSSVLVQQPADMDSDQFCFSADGHEYAPAIIVFRKTGYSAAKVLLTDLSLGSKNDPTATFYDLFWAKEQKGQNWVWVPKLVRDIAGAKPTDLIRSIAGKVAGTGVEPIDSNGGEE